MPIGTNNSVVPGCGMHHIAIQCRDLEKSLGFYQDVLGMTAFLEFGGDRKIVLMDMGDGSYVELLGPMKNSPQVEPVKAAANPLVHLALTTTDARAAVEKVRKAGYSITVEPNQVMLNTLPVINAFFTGPDGEVIEFFQVLQ